MEIISLMLISIILILILSEKNKVSNKLIDVEDELKALGREINRLKTKPSFDTFNKPEPVKPKEEIKPITPVIPEPIVQNDEYWKTKFQVVDTPENVQTPKPIEVEKPVLPIIPQEEITSRREPVVPVIEKSFFEKNPDVEKFIGENLISKIGIAILVIAIGIFVKYAIDNNWIGPVGRVSVGLFFGAILIGIAHYLRNSYKAFSSVLVGGGLAIFYFTITLAYHQFQLFNQTTAFMIMVIITAFAVALSLLYNKQELAVIALLGGFCAPFLVSSGNGNYKTLFSYLIILNSGLLIIAYHKGWRLLNQLAFFFTTLIFAVWLFALNNNSVVDYKYGLLFASIFYILFFATNVANNLKENKKFLAADFSILLINTCVFFGFGLYCIENFSTQNIKGIFCALLAVINLIIAYAFLKNKKIDTNILYLLIGITLTFVSLTAPLQLNGNYITLFWASETVIIYWLYKKSEFKILNIASIIVWLAMLISLFMDIYNVYNYPTDFVSIVFNKGFVTIVYAAISSYLLSLLKKNTTDVKFSSAFFKNAAIILLYTAGAIEIFYQFTHYYPNIALNLLYLVLYTFVFVISLSLLSKLNNSLQANNIQLFVLNCLCLVLFVLSISETYAIQTIMLEQNMLKAFFVAHWCTAFLVIVSFYLTIKAVHTNQAIAASKITAFAICLFVVLFLSVELHFIINSIFFSSKNNLATIQRVYIKSVLPILWGICSFAFMWFGMKNKMRFLRIISLSLFTITLVKLFAFDITNIPVAGKIAAFFCLGVLLLIVSFMYQRLKKIVTEDEEKNNM